MAFAGGHGHGHSAAASGDAAAAAAVADMMEQGRCVRLRPQLPLVTPGGRAAEERERAKKRSPSRRSRPTMTIGRVLFAGLVLGLSLVYFVTATSLPMNNATRASFLIIAFAPLLLAAAGTVLLQRAEGTS